MTATPDLCNERTGASWAFDVGTLRAPDDQGPLRLPPGPGLRRSDIDGSSGTLWRYARALRVRADDRVELGAGMTPLVMRRRAGRDVLFKLDHLMPSGSFKDRGSAILFTALKSAGVTRIIEDSSGNAGSSYAMYGAAAGMACRIYAPAAAPAGKLKQTRLLGAEVVGVPGSRDDVAEAVRSDTWGLYVGHSWHPLFFEGTKTVAFELWEQLGFRAPDWVLAPLGQGCNIIGLFDGFRELLAAGSIDRLPRIAAVQAEASAPFALAASQGTAALAGFTPRATLADGIASGQPVRLHQVLGAIAGSGGTILTVPEDAIMPALQDLTAQGFFVEPTCAVSLVALDRLLAAGAIGRDEIVVTLLTGSGFKTIDRVLALAGEHHSPAGPSPG